MEKAWNWHSRDLLSSLLMTNSDLAQATYLSGVPSVKLKNGTRNIQGPSSSNISWSIKRRLSSKLGFDTPEQVTQAPTSGVLSSHHRSFGPFSKTSLGVHLIMIFKSTIYLQKWIFGKFEAKIPSFLGNTYRVRCNQFLKNGQSHNFVYFTGEYSKSYSKKPP